MSSYPQRVSANILPRSVSQTLPEAFREWSFTDTVEDHEEAEEVCQLCDQEQLRYHFLIRNELTSHELWIGSRCILKFGISVYDERRRKLSPEESKKKLDLLMEQMRLESCLKALHRLAVTENNEILQKALAYYKQHKVLTPKFAFVVFWRLQTHRIDHSPSFFKISLKRIQHKKDLREMQPSRVHLIWPALSSSQRKMVQAMGHSPPPSALPPG